MLQDLDKTLEKILRERGKIAKKDIDVAFDQPTSEWSGRLNRPTLNLFCFDLRENMKLRRPDRVTRVDNGTKRAQITLPPRRMDLTYLVTAWARQMEDEHQLLWRALQTLKPITVLKPGECEGGLVHQSLDLPVSVADMTEPKANMVDLWSVLDNQLKLGFTICITVELDLDYGLDVPLVLEAELRVGQALDPTQEQLTTPDVEIKHSQASVTSRNGEKESNDRT